MFKVTLKIKPNNEWVDGPVLLVKPTDMEAFSEIHSFFKCEDATLDDGYIYKQWEAPKTCNCRADFKQCQCGKVEVPSAWKGFLV